MKEVWIDAICGQGIRSHKAVKLFEKYIEFTGNQNNESWEFDRTSLEEATEDVLEAFYYRLKTVNKES